MNKGMVLKFKIQKSEAKRREERAYQRQVCTIPYTLHSWRVLTLAEQHQHICQMRASNLVYHQSWSSSQNSFARAPNDIVSPSKWKIVIIIQFKDQNWKFACKLDAPLVDTWQAGQTLDFYFRDQKYYFTMNSLFGIKFACGNPCKVLRK